MLLIHAGRQDKSVDQIEIIKDEYVQPPTWLFTTEQHYQ
jgi:hypothetical protein